MRYHTVEVDGFIVTLLKPEVSPWMYWKEFLFLLCSFATPFIAWRIVGWDDKLANSGSIMLFFAAIAEFSMLHKVNDKHLINACRVMRGGRPLDFSEASSLVGWLSLIAALCGTILWGYGYWFIDHCH